MFGGESVFGRGASIFDRGGSIFDRGASFFGGRKFGSLGRGGGIVISDEDAEHAALRTELLATALVGPRLCPACSRPALQRARCTCPAAVLTQCPFAGVCVPPACALPAPESHRAAAAAVCSAIPTRRGHNASGEVSYSTRCPSAASSAVLRRIMFVR